MHQAVTEYLMPIFFLMIGIELRHEMTEGTLITASQRMLPLIAAIGGIVIPAVIFLFTVFHAAEFRDGWAIPTATDIAFALCVLNLVGKKIPPSAKIFLLAIAIFDDLCAILIIAVFYSGQLALIHLFAALICMAALLGLRHYNTVRPLPYLLVGTLLAIAIHAGGIHTTIAGVITGLCLPRYTAQRMMAWLHPLVAFAVLPLFAFVSAGVSFAHHSLDTLQHPLALGILLALCIGKPLGILAAVKLAIHLRLAKLPLGTNWQLLTAIATLAGIGFTMSLLIGQLAFPTAPASAAIVTLSVLIASTISAVLGGFLLRGGSIFLNRA